MDSQVSSWTDCSGENKMKFIIIPSRFDYWSNRTEFRPNNYRQEEQLRLNLDFPKKKPREDYNRYFLNHEDTSKYDGWDGDLVNQ